MGQARTEDRGSFTHAVCRACGWRGPARRARASAERDAQLHDLSGCPMQEAESAGAGATWVDFDPDLVDEDAPGGADTRMVSGHRRGEVGADGGSQAHGIPLAVGESGVAPGRERLTAHGRS